MVRGTRTATAAERPDRTPEPGPEPPRPESRPAPPEDGAAASPHRAQRRAPRRAPRRTLRRPRALAAALATAVLPLALALGPGTGATPARAAAHTATAVTKHAAAAPLCVSSSHPALAARLSSALRAAMAGRTDSIAFSVNDARTRTTCGYRTSAHYDSASVVKATIMGAVLRRALDRHRHLTSSEVSLLTRMITHSDNNAATALWNSLGRSRMQSFLNLAGLTQTTLGRGGYWGLTRITARDEMRLLTLYAEPNPVLSERSRAYGLKLMHEVVASQRWGTPYGTPKGVTWHVKNGWLPRSTRGWRVHSLGVFTGSGRDYRMAVLTDDNPSMSYGITTIQRIALAVHHAVG